MKQSVDHLWNTLAFAVVAEHWYHGISTDLMKSASVAVNWIGAKNDSRHYLYRMGIVCVLVHCERGGERAMKQIFDWLREQINRSIYSIFLQNNHGVKFKAIDVADVESIINEAEAKWEAEVKVCEWKQEKYLNFALSTCNTSCGNRNSIIDAFKFCPYCGKPIKISEVE